MQNQQTYLSTLDTLYHNRQHFEMKHHEKYKDLNRAQRHQKNYSRWDQKKFGFTTEYVLQKRKNLTQSEAAVKASFSVAA